MKFLWGKKSIDERFFNFFAEIALRMLESKNLLKFTEAKNAVFNVLESVLTDHADSMRICVFKMINLIYHEDESLVDSISDFFVRAYNCNRSSMTKFTTETLTSLVSFILEKTNVNTESGAVRNTKEILTKVLPNLLQN